MSQVRDLRGGLLFTSPWLIGLTVFMAYPLFAALYYSFTDYSVLLPPVFVGLENYLELFQDELFYKSLYNTLVFAVGSVGLGLFSSLCLALLLNSNIRGISVYRTIFFLPSLMPVVASAILWMWMYSGENGVINSALARLGIDGPAWLPDPAWAKTAIIIMSVWGSGHAMVVFMAGLKDVPTQLYEAAIIDGANWFQRLIHVTLPTISPVIMFNTLMGLISGFQVFTQGFVMTDTAGNPLPEQSTLFYVLQIYNVGFNDLRMGYACAMSWVLFAIIFLLTLLMTRLSGRFVSYDR
jgi:multiple sugar transport system permease protein